MGADFCRDPGHIHLTSSLEQICHMIGMIWEWAFGAYAYTGPVRANGAENDADRSTRHRISTQVRPLLSIALPTSQNAIRPWSKIAMHVNQSVSSLRNPASE